MFIVCMAVVWFWSDIFSLFVPPVLWHYWLDWLSIMKSIRPVKIQWWGIGVVICRERGADCLQLDPLPDTSLSLAPVKSRLVLPFWYRLTQVVLEKRPLNGCSSVVVVYVYAIYFCTFFVFALFCQYMCIMFFCYGRPATISWCLHWQSVCHCNSWYILSMLCTW